MTLPSTPLPAFSAINESPSALSASAMHLAGGVAAVGSMDGKQFIWALRTSKNDMAVAPDVLAFIAQSTPESLEELTNAAKNTPLMLAARDAPQYVAALLPKSNPRTRERLKGNTALIMAVEEGHTEAVRLLAPHSDCHQQIHGHGGETPLTLAAHNGHGEIAEIIIANSPVERRLEMRRQALALGVGSLDCIRRLCDKETAAPSSENGVTPLMLAAKQPSVNRKNALECVELLLADSDLEARFCGETALSTAIKHGKLDIALFLAKKTDWPQWFQSRKEKTAATGQRFADEEELEKIWDGVSARAHALRRPVGRDGKPLAMTQKQRKEALAERLEILNNSEIRAFDNPLSFFLDQNSADVQPRGSEELGQLLRLAQTKMAEAGQADRAKAAFSAFAACAQWAHAEALSEWASLDQMTKVRDEWLDLDPDFGSTEPRTFAHVMPLTHARLEAAELALIMGAALRPSERASAKSPAESSEWSASSSIPAESVDPSPATTKKRRL